MNYSFFSIFSFSRLLLFSCSSAKTNYYCVCTVKNINGKKQRWAREFQIQSFEIITPLSVAFFPYTFYSVFLNWYFQISIRHCTKAGWRVKIFFICLYACREEVSINARCQKGWHMAVWARGEPGASRRKKKKKEKGWLMFLLDIRRWIFYKSNFLNNVGN